MKATVITLLLTVIGTALYLIFTSSGQILTPPSEGVVSPYNVATSTLESTSTSDTNPPLPDNKPPELGVFGSPLVVPNGGQLRFPDGLIMTITGINDSRCPEGAQCIWAGEISVEMTVVGGTIKTGEALTLGSITVTSKNIGPYTISLITSTPYTATISVVVGELKKPTAVGTVMGTVSIGPICPVEREGVPCEISAEVYTSRNVVVYAKNGITVITKQPLDTTGHFKLDLAPGHYQLQIDPAGISAGEKKPITVVSGETMVTDFDIDTGIR